MQRAVKRLVRRFGFDVVRHDAHHSAEVRRRSLLASRHVDVAIDVGANDGSYGAALRANGFSGRLVSFEPQRSAFEQLARRSATDPNWTVHRAAVGRTSGLATLNLAANSSSSSLLAIAARHLAVAPESATVGTEEVEVVALDDLHLLTPGQRAYLKVDVQGYELEVLLGSARTLSQAALLEIELSLVPLYGGAPSLPEVITYLTNRGFALAGLDPVLVDPTDGSLLQVDAMFVSS